MNIHTRYSGGRGARRARSRGFTLVELLTVIAIISLLISILVPSVSKARDAAKNAKTRTIMKNMGDGFELFVTENAPELRGQNYPSSRAGDDPTETGPYPNPLIAADMSGAQWAVRYLMGKKLDGYVPRKVVPPVLLPSPPVEGWEQKNWYGTPIDNDGDWPQELTDPLPRAGPYLDAGAVKLKAPKNLAKVPPIDSANTDPRYNNPVIVDSFDMPILYYSANSLVAAKSSASITTFKYDPTDPNAATPGIYTYSDNALFTGLCYGGASGSCLVPRWDFGNGNHKLEYGPSETWTSDLAALPDAIKTQPYSFPYYIMNKDAYESSGQKAVVPSRKDSYILISPGKDGLFGTGDDVTTFQ